MPYRRTSSSLSHSTLEDTRVCPDRDHDGRAARWYLFTLIDHSPQLLPMGHVAALELSCDRRRELKSWGARGDPGAVLCQETGDGDTGHVAVPELSCARRREPGPQGTWRS
jgi:hypothetical protein